MQPDSGEVEIFGQEMGEDLKNRIGYLPEERGLYKRLTAIELICYLARLKGMKKNDAEERADQLLRRVGMDEYKNKKNKEMSKGMGQLVQFVSTVVHDPDLIILDEPFSGLDPVRTEAVQSIITDFRDKGRSIILCTHQMNKVEELCDLVLMMHKGQTVLYGEVMETRAKFRRNSIRISAEGDLGKLPGVIETKTKNGFSELILESGSSSQVILDILRGKGIVINHFEVVTPHLRDIFLEKAGVVNE